MAYPKNRLPEWFPDAYVKLLDDHDSDETKKARRNLLVGSFFIVSLYLVGIPLSDMRFLGAPLYQGNVLRIVVLAIVLMVYFLVRFAVYASRDLGLLWHRKRRVDDPINRLTKELDREVKLRKQNPDQNRPNFEAVGKEFGILQLLRKQTVIPRRAKIIGLIFEVVLPPLLGIAALAYLGTDLYSRLTVEESIIL